MNLSEAVPGEAGNLEADGIRSDINRGKGRHGRGIVYREGEKTGLLCWIERIENLEVDVLKVP